MAALSQRESIPFPLVIGKRETHERIVPALCSEMEKAREDERGARQVNLDLSVTPGLMSRKELMCNDVLVMSAIHRCVAECVALIVFFSTSLCVVLSSIVVGLARHTWAFGPMLRVGTWRQVKESYEQANMFILQK